MILKTLDGSFVDESGKVLFFSCERFVRDICEGDCCFVCGAHPANKPFNNEHVLPNWLLRRYGLHKNSITLPNDTLLRYDQYTIPCCADCNALMGREVEEPIRQLLEQDTEAIYSHVQENGTLRLFTWLALLFLKVHLKDRTLRWDRDLREPDNRIGELHTWEELHHIHALSRTFYSNCVLSKEAVGSLLIVSARQFADRTPFDFADLSQAQTMLLRLDDIAFLAVFNDSCGAIQGLMPKLERITGPVHGLQIRELMAELAFVNLHLEQRPSFYTKANGETGECSIEAAVPADFALGPMDISLRGQLLHQAVRHAYNSLQVPGYTQEQMIAGIQAGDLTFLFDIEGKFISYDDPPPQST